MPEWFVISTDASDRCPNRQYSEMARAWGLRSPQSTRSAVRTPQSTRRPSSLVVARYSLVVALGVSANQFRRPIGIRRRLASRGPHTGSSTVTSVGGRCWRLWVRLRVVGGRFRVPSALLKIIYVSSFLSRPSVRVWLCVVRSEWKHNNNKPDVVYSPFPGAVLATSWRFMMTPRTTISVHGATTAAVNLCW